MLLSSTNLTTSFLQLDLFPKKTKIRMTLPQCLRSLPGVLRRPELLEVGVSPLRVREGRGGVPVPHDHDTDYTPTIPSRRQ